jgi:hypothetical protein
MIAMSKTKPVPNAAIGKSAICASCHTVTIGGLLEQATSLEWQASIYARTDRPCQGCHQPSGDPAANDATPISTPFSNRPPNSPPRDDFRHHQLLGGSAYLLNRLSVNTDWLGAGATVGPLVGAASDTLHFLSTAASLTITPTDDGIHVTVRNHTGHKLPTGFPTRRMWLHVVALDAQDSIVFESGSHRRGAVLVGGRGIRIDEAGTILPHRTSIERPDQVAIWEAVPVDAHDRPTHLMFAATKFVKDDRILPDGWVDDQRTSPIGVAGDADFVPGSDGVHYKLPASTARVEVELLYQAIPPETLESYRASESPEAARFLSIMDTPPLPHVLATAQYLNQPAPP